MAIPKFMGSEGMADFKLVVVSERDGVSINLALPEGPQAELDAKLVSFLTFLVKSEKLLSALRSVSLLQEAGLREDVWAPLLAEANQMKNDLYGQSVAGDFDVELFKRQRG